MLRRGIYAAAITAVLGAGPALAQYDLPISRPAAAREPADPKPVHRYELLPEHGEFLVAAQTFRAAAAGDDKHARTLAEGLVEYIRTECRLYAFVYARGWALRQERKKEKDAVVAAIRKHYAGKETEEQIAARIKREVKLARIADEYVVFVAPGKGSLKTMEEAIKFAKYVHELPAPPADFCDSVVVGAEVSEVTRRRGEARNPFPMAMAGRNPTLPKKEVAAERPKADDFLLGLNAGKPYSLIHQTKKPFTLVVQTYGEKFGLSRMVRPGDVVQADGRANGELLERAAQQAHAVAKLLREKKYDAYVLHTKFESFVCVGEYDSEKDEQLLANAKAFALLQLRDDKRGTIIETFMERPMPAIIPRK
jgi:hypothetical protein